ncbi:hypothetical protein Taro_020795 [Colocasia esculenta]|uniref:Secreted protein n=1 Tax=Colocasia esculenta TaxID=4460 RepID=A0A843V6A9_COLES|nr:hypothetical protein [Colocasia esculenta]
MIFKHPCSRALNASILSNTLWVWAFRCICSSRPSSKTPRWVSVCAHMYMFLRKLFPSGGSAQIHIHRRFCPKTYSYVHNFVLICICFLKETLPKQRFCPEIHPYVHKYMFICICLLKGTLPKQRLYPKT